MFVVQASRLPKAAETAAPQLLSNLRLSWNKTLGCGVAQHFRHAFIQYFHDLINFVFRHN